MLNRLIRIIIIVINWGKCRQMMHTMCTVQHSSHSSAACVLGRIRNVKSLINWKWKWKEKEWTKLIQRKPSLQNLSQHVCAQTNISIKSQVDAKYPNICCWFCYASFFEGWITLYRIFIRYFPFLLRSKNICVHFPYALVVMFVVIFLDL